MSLPARTLAASLNHVIHSAPWSLEALRQHAGRTAVVAIAPFEFAFSVTATGEIRAAAAEAARDVRIDLPPLAALRFAAGDSAAARVANVEGDAAFAATLRLLAQNLAWDFEEDLSKFIGDIAAHRLAAGLRGAAAWPREAGARAAQAVAEYATEEAGMLPPSAAVESWFAEVDRVRDDAERIEKRIARLESKRR
ncbi:MAG: hypothetical protein ABI794_08905 [Betaproteobacteria bacterium]